MSSERVLSRQVHRRTLLKGAAATGAAAFAAPFLNLRYGLGQSNATITYMSNQRHDRAVKEELFQQFTEETGIQVEMQIFADDYPNQLQLAFESGTPPDIFNMNQPRQQVEAGWAEPLDSYLADTPGLEESFLPGAFVKNRGIWNDQKHGLPMYAQTMRLYYNKTLFENAGLDPNTPPATFTELREFSKAITEGTGVPGFIFGDKFPWVWWMNGTCLGQGGGGYNFNWATGQYEFNHPAIQEAIQLIRDMEEDGSVFPGAHTLTDDDARQQFSLGLAGMIIGGSWNPGVFNDQFSSTEDWETAELPLPDSGQAGRHQQGIGDRYTISAQSEFKAEAWEWMKWMYSVPIMTEMYTRGMGVMGVAEANTGESDVRGVPALAPTERDFIIPPEPELPQQTPTYEQVMQEVFDGVSSAEEGLTRITEQYNQSLEETGASGAIDLADFTIPEFDPMNWQPT